METALHKIGKNRGTSLFSDHTLWACQICMEVNNLHFPAFPKSAVNLFFIFRKPAVITKSKALSRVRPVLLCVES